MNDRKLTNICQYIRNENSMKLLNDNDIEQITSALKEYNEERSAWREISDLQDMLKEVFDDVMRLEKSIQKMREDFDDSSKCCQETWDKMCNNAYEIAQLKKLIEAEEE